MSRIVSQYRTKTKLNVSRRFIFYLKNDTQGVGIIIAGSLVRWFVGFEPSAPPLPSSFTTLVGHHYTFTIQKRTDNKTIETKKPTMMTLSRPSCFFCGSSPDSINDMGIKTCFRHKNSFDLTTGGGGSVNSTTGTKRSIHDIEHVDNFAVPHIEGVKGKKKARGPVVKQRECIICMGKFRTSGVTCGSGDHHSCKSCTRDYITKTLGSRGTVYFDRVPCVQPDCWSLIPAKEAKGVLTKKVLADFEKKEWDMSYLIGGDRDPSSQTLLDKDSRECPNCGIPITKTQGCSHMVCVCQHEFWYDCKCANYPFHEDGCSQGYPQARVVDN